MDFCDWERCRQQNCLAQSGNCGKRTVNLALTTPLRTRCPEGKFLSIRVKKRIITRQGPSVMSGGKTRSDKRIVWVTTLGAYAPLVPDASRVVATKIK